LYFLPEDDEDGNWPHRCLRKLLENIDSKEIERGLILSSFNSRGANYRSTYEGGKQERELASMWAGRANKLSTAWPKSSALCSKISKNWEIEATREDQSSEKDNLRDW